MALPMRPTQLVEHDAALVDLLNQLLGEVPDTVSPVDADSVTAAPRPTFATGDEDASPSSLEVSTPSWGQDGFRALLFRIGEQRLAVPLIALHSVARLESPLTAVPGQPSWCLGAVDYRGQSMVVADLARLFGFTATMRCPRFLLVLGQGGEAIACDSIDEPLDVSADDIRWAGKDREKAWHLGVLITELCVVLDPQAIENRIRHG